MATEVDVVVPDLGEFSDIPVIEVLVAPGDKVGLEDPLITLESDKATMDIPAPQAGTVGDILVSLGDTVSEGDIVVRLLVDESASASAAPSEGDAPVPETAPTPPATVDTVDAAPPPSPPPMEPAAPSMHDVDVPDLGEFSDIPVIEILVSVGDVVAFEDPLLTLESDKATMEIPAPVAGAVSEMLVQVGDTVSTGDIVARIASTEMADGPGVVEETIATDPEPAPARATSATRGSAPDDDVPTPPVDDAPNASAPDPRAPSSYQKRPSPTASLPSSPSRRGARFHATPAIRRFARNLGVDLTEVTGTGRKGRILEEDVTQFVKQRMTANQADGSAGAGIPPIPEIDFTRFGEVETRPLSRIKRIGGTNLHRSWLNIPLVTHHDEADVTELEAFRQALKKDRSMQGVRVTLLAFIFRALTATLKTFPTFNASLSPDGESLIIKHYFHIGMAVDTPNGLVVPVLRDVDQKGIAELANEMSEVSARARDGKLKLTDLEGASMTISSLGGIGGTGFTPLVNAPEVAILGVARTKMTPQWDGNAFQPRLMLPLSLSYDHRVIDGAEGARFVAHLGALLTDVRRLLL
ncbi:MAG: dihydrolipoyllysine-residue acetyltransferase [Pseudomonadota bacterium]